MLGRAICLRLLSRKLIDSFGAQSDGDLSFARQILTNPRSTRLAYDALTVALNGASVVAILLVIRYTAFWVTQVAPPC